MRTSWDIFCRVVDNFGDIGVTWRLARQLASEYDADVRLWVDDLTSFQRLCPSLNVQLAMQTVHGVQVCKWPEQGQHFSEPGDVADVVIEAFACDLPAPYIEAMAQRTTPPLWLNLEYLSAEPWVEGCHGLPSPQINGLGKFFFFPGFTPATGGLLREESLIDKRIQFQNSPECRQRFMQQTGIAAAQGARIFSLFSYENPAIGSWLSSLAAHTEQPTHLLVPEGKILHDIKHWLEVSSFGIGQIIKRGALTIQVLPFLSQQDYDLLLWLCDFNVVRGEDSFIRAQWAGRPFLWHIYPQDEDAHLVKLNAFLALYCQGLTEASASAFSGLSLDWNKGVDLEAAWATVSIQWADLTGHADVWCQQQIRQQDLTKSLVQFYQNWI